MARPTKSSMCGLRKLLGYLRNTSGYAVLLPVPEPGRGKMTHVDKHLILESYSDSDWSGHQAHRRSTSSAIHYVNSCPVFASARTQRVVSLSSCEAELHALVSAAADGKYIAGCHSFLAGCEVEHHGYVDNASAKSLANKRGVGKVRHLAGKLLWVQNCTADGSLKISQIGTLFSAADLATKPLSIARMRALMFLCNIVDLELGFEMVGEEEFETLVKKDQFGKSVTKMAKMLFRIGLAMEIFTGADGSPISGDGVCTMDEAPAAISLSFWTPSGFALALAVLAISAVFCWMGWMIHKLQKGLNQVEMDHIELLGEHTDMKNAVEKIQVFSENLWGSMVELGGYMADHETALTEERRSELEQREIENHEIARQDDSSDERLLSMQRTIMRMHRRFFEMTKLHTHLWMGLVRLGGFIGSNTITGELHSDLVDRNNKIMEEWQNQGQTNLLVRRRHSTPPGGTPRAAMESQAVGTEGEESEHTQDHPDDFIDEDGTVLWCTTNRC